MIKKALLFFILVSLNLVAIAQLPCGADYMYHKAIQQDPAYAKRRAEFEKAKIINSVFTIDTSRKIIPVVVHIMHNNGKGNVTKAQVMDAMRILNEDFQKRNKDTANVVPDFKSIIGNTNFEFRLASIDPNGNCTDGITRTDTPLSDEADDNVKDLIRWDPASYLNIWVVNKISFSAGGYSYYPGVGPDIDGIVVVNVQFGGIGYSSGSNFAKRTLTHEVGHYMNLPHVWGENNSVGVACGDDGVSDTPITKGANQVCDYNQSTCGALDNVQNFMDYCSCICMFTQGQSERMRDAINGTLSDRNNLWSPANLSLTGTSGSPQICKPVAEFYSDINLLCEGASVKFFDNSTNGNPTFWKWTFPGGTPSVSTDSMPIIQYNTAGVYDVKLVCGNVSGIDSVSKSFHITIKPAQAKYSGTSYAEYFENASLISQEWEISNSMNKPLNWLHNSSAGYAGSSCMELSNFTYAFSEKGEYFDLISPSIDLSKIPSASALTFKVAYAHSAQQEQDRLSVYLSVDCGKSWIPRYTKVGTSLKTVTAAPGFDFTPTLLTDWRTETVAIGSQFTSAKNAIFKFQFVQGSNPQDNLFIDDINILSPVGVIDVYSKPASVSIVPNPFKEETRIYYTLLTDISVQIELLNILGENLAVLTHAYLSAGEHILDFNSTLASLPNGVYILRFNLNGGIANYKLIKQ